MYDYIFLALAKNCSKYLNNYFYFINKLSKTKKVLVIVGEDSSTDDTYKILIEQKKKINLVVIKTKSISKFKSRLKRLSLGRQILKDYINKKKYKSKLIVVNDLDEIFKKKISLKNFLKISNILQKNNKFLFGISVKSKPFYYDLLVLKIKDVFEYDVLKIQKSYSIKSILQRISIISNYKRKITYMDDLKSISSYNGMCIYIFEDYQKGSYISKGKKNIYNNIDHLSLNLGIHSRTKKYILISNTLNLFTPKQHLPKNLIQLLYYNFIKKFI